MKIDARSVRRLVPVAAALTLGMTPGAARAQTPIEITANGGLLLPLADVYHSVVLTRPTFQSQRFLLTSKAGHAPALGIGGRLTAWLSPRLALEGAVLYSQSRINISNEFQELGEPLPRPVVEQPFRSAQHATVLAVTARARVRLGPTDSPLRFTLAGGGGVLSRGGDAYENLDGTVDFTAVLGAGLGVQVAPGVAVRVDVEDYLSWTGFETSFTTLPGGPLPPQPFLDDGRFQNDIVISQGITIVLAGP